MGANGRLRSIEIADYRANLHGSARSRTTLRYDLSELSLGSMDSHRASRICLLALLNACGGATGLWVAGEGTISDPMGGSAADRTHVVVDSSTAGGGGGGSASEGGSSVTGDSTSGTGSTAAATGGSSAAAVSAEELDRATASCGTTSTILSGLVPNSRGLGGVPILNGAVACDRLYRGSQLSAMGGEGCAEFANLGIRTIIDLRTVSEAAAAASPACVERQAKRVFAPMPTPYGLTAQEYVADLKQPESLRAVFAVLGQPAAYPVYFHCIYGRDRTGVLVALLLRLLGATREVVMAEYMRTVEAGMGGAPTSLLATLDEIDQLGGAEAFLVSSGVSTESISVFRAQATMANSTE